MTARKGFDLDFADGEPAERLLWDIVMNIGPLCEVKRDFGYVESGNFFVEYSYRGQPSGLASTEAHWWAFQYDEGGILMVDTERLKNVARRLLPGVPGGDRNDSMGVLLRPDRLLHDQLKDAS